MILDNLPDMAILKPYRAKYNTEFYDKFLVNPSYKRQKNFE